jgi:hypothetical protein
LSISLSVAVLLWLNLYWCREVFFLDHFDQMQSIRGFWEALARLGHFSWTPQWWPYSYNGTPFEYAYSPGVPALIAIICKVTGWSAGRAFGVIAGSVFCIGPIALFWMAKEFTQRIGWSFVAALAYSLLTPSLLLVPDAEFHWRHVRDSQRIMLMFEWDEVPHQLALALIMISTTALVRALRGCRLWWWTAGAFFAFAMFVGPFGGVAGALFLALASWSCDKGSKLRQMLFTAACGLAGYFVICPFYPPSLVQVIRQNANLSADYGWTSSSVWAVLIVVSGTLSVFLLSRRLTWHLRCFLLLTFVFFAIPFLAARWNVHFVPQPGRYKVELDVALALLVAFTAAAFLDRAPRAARVVLSIVLLIPIVSLVKIHRVDAKHFLRPSDLRDTIEYRAASWLESNAPRERVMAPGSIGFWMNRFTEQQQFMGGSFTTIPTLTMQIATWGVTHLNPADPRRDVAQHWLQAYGVDALVVAGPDSPEPWKQFAEPRQYAALFPLLWRESDTSIYSVPRTYRSLASFVPQSRIVRRELTSFFQMDEIEPYVAAMESPASQADWQWLDNNRGVARGSASTGAVLSLHITYHPGWKAFVNDSAAPVTSDALEQIVVSPHCNGPCEVKLIYDGGREAKATRVVSLFTLIAAAAGFAIISRRAKRPSENREQSAHLV